MSIARTAKKIVSLRASYTFVLHISLPKKICIGLQKHYKNMPKLYKILPKLEQNGVLVQ